jgi:hypothetical protein
MTCNKFLQNRPKKRNPTQKQPTDSSSFFFFFKRPLGHREANANGQRSNGQWPMAHDTRYQAKAKPKTKTKTKTERRKELKKGSSPQQKAERRAQSAE